MWSSSSSATKSANVNPSSTSKQSSSSIQLASHFNVPSRTSNNSSSSFSGGGSGSGFGSGGGNTSILQPTLLSSSSRTHPSFNKASKLTPPNPLIGPFPLSIHTEIVSFLALPDVPAYARTCRALARAVMEEEKSWEKRCVLAGVDVKLQGSASGRDSETIQKGITEPISESIAASALDTGPGPLDQKKGSAQHHHQSSRTSFSHTIISSSQHTEANGKQEAEEDDEFGDFSEVAINSSGSASASASASTGYNMSNHGAITNRNGNGNANIPSLETSLLDLEFEDSAHVPLPSNPHPSRRRGSSSIGGGRTSGFFALKTSANGYGLEQGAAATARTSNDFPDSPQLARGRNSFSFKPGGPGYTHPIVPNTGRGTATSSKIQQCPSYIAFRAHHSSLMPYIRILRTSSSSSSDPTSYTHTSSSTISPSQILSLLFPTSGANVLSHQAMTLQALLRYLSDAIQPTKDWGWLRQVLGGVCDRFEAICLSFFENAESRVQQQHQGNNQISSSLGSTGMGVGATSANAIRSETELKHMKLAAESSWVVWKTLQATKTQTDLRTGRSLASGFGSRSRVGAGDDDAAEWELGRVWVEKREVFYEGSKWESGQNLLKISNPSGTIHQLDFSPMNEFMAYITRCILVDGQEAINIFPGQAGVSVVKAYAERLASDVIAEYINPLLSQCRLLSQSLFLTACAASFVQAWGLVNVIMSVIPSNSAVETLEVVRRDVEASFFRMFETNMDEYLEEEAEWIKDTLAKSSKGWESKLGTTVTRGSGGGEAAFLASSNPDQVKRNVLAGFKNVLLLPVTIVPSTISYGANAVVSGGQAVVGGLSMLNPQKWMQPSTAKVVQETTTNGVERVAEVIEPAIVAEPDVIKVDLEENVAVEAEEHVPPTIAGATAAAATESTRDAFDQFQLMLSLDTVLELIQADRESLKRVETFQAYPGQYGLKVRETIEEIFIVLLQAVGNRHVAPGFKQAIDQMSMYKPSEHAMTTSVAPLLQFFELVHIGDTIQSMIQVYFDKELARYIDKTDFLNGAIQEKKRFECTLDDSVAAGLNAGIEVLMNQVEHIIQIKTKAREYYPLPGAPMELGATEGCQEAIACLEMHCNLLRGSTSKEVLEVFFQEVGIRLQAILQKHIKRQIISLEGGFQMIADLNAYYNFVASLKQPRITEDFSFLKMIGHVYIVEDAKDLAAIVRDATRYGGTYRPEDIYEFIQRRSDWKKIEKTVDKAMYAISVKEDCVIM